MTCTRNLPHCIRHEREIEPQNIPAFHVLGACKHHQPSMPTCVSMQTSSRARDVFCSGAVASWSSPVSLRFAHLQNRQAPQDACGVKSQLVAIVHVEASMPGPSRSERASQKRGYLFFLSHARSSVLQRHRWSKSALFATYSPALLLHLQLGDAGNLDTVWVSP